MVDIPRRHPDRVRNLQRKMFDLHALIVSDLSSGFQPEVKFWKKPPGQGRIECLKFSGMRSLAARGTAGPAYLRAIWRFILSTLWKRCHAPVQTERLERVSNSKLRDSFLAHALLNLGQVVG